MTTFNPNDPGMANGNYFALPFNTEESEIVIITAPWDVTTSYRPGTSDGPEAIMAASLQVDLFDVNVPEAWEIKIGTDPAEPSMAKKNKKYRKMAEKVIAHLEEGGDPAELDDIIGEINTASAELNSFVEERSRNYTTQGIITAVLGGDHSVPLGNMKAVASSYEDFGILHIDAHADLRIAYEGFTYSHASIMYNALNEIPQVSQLTQVGIRDFCQQEADIINTDPRIRCYTDIELRNHGFEGKTWKKQCEEIVATLPSNVYISFDIDALSPDLCPNTGTPVPGGLSFREADYLLWTLASSGKKIIGFDLCEVAPGSEGEWDANVGARVLYKMCIYTSYNKNKNSLR
ncbi:MAG: agmatinase family protein [Bacteroidia bacterium]|nr:agmatinase family protein [Bacteroidia bacterium]